MSLIPKIQYLFRTLQIPLPKQYLKNMQHTINTFIWEGKKARVAAGTLQQAGHPETHQDNSLPHHHISKPDCGKKTMPPTLQGVIKQVKQNWEYELMAAAQFGARTHIYEAHKTWKASTKPEVRVLEAIDTLEGRTQTTHQGPQKVESTSPTRCNGKQPS
ncbi:Hypothetical predicted protein [Pelobates cultripes]|uniref:Uncharacterized protein n=1 Tax=Pelobates cultripes TaxID=61616 RepID=A0AAD1RQG9_PELCU|nr:Hypothetical predicted protein [Pelobates cultripes]